MNLLKDVLLCNQINNLRGFSSRDRIVRTELIGRANDSEFLGGLYKIYLPSRDI